MPFSYQDGIGMKQPYPDFHKNLIFISQMSRIQIEPKKEIVTKGKMPLLHLERASLPCSPIVKQAINQMSGEGLESGPTK